MADLLVEEEFKLLLSSLERHHELFSSLWQIGAPRFTEEIETAAIVYSSSGAPVRFLFNPKFWRSLPNYDREFVVCHEMLHVVLNHGFRSKDIANRELTNIAADIAVNHLLVERFGFVRELLQDWTRCCWVDTVFAAPLPPTNLTMEQYYDMLTRLDLIQTPPPLDVHLFESTSVGSIRNLRAAKEVDELLRTLIPHLRADLLERLGEEGRARSMRGKEALGAWFTVTPEPPPKIPWERIVRKRLRLTAEEGSESWSREHRRLGSFTEFSLPGIDDQQRILGKKTRQRCVFFIDASGSVFNLQDRFFALVQSLPSHLYDIELCSFDTLVYQLDIREPVVRGGGGTSFRILEDYLKAPSSGRETLRMRYPDVVFVLTDGFGDKVCPRHPDRWHWLLTTDYEELIPPGSVKYLLEDFC